MLKLSQFLGPDSFFARDFTIPWARELEVATGGRVQVVLSDGSSPLGGIANQARQVEAGTVDIALGLRGAEGDRFPLSSVIELPFLVQDAASGSRALWNLYRQGGLGPEWDRFKVLALFVQNPGLIHTASVPVRLPADLRGLRLRAPNQPVAAALKALGAEPLLLQVNDVMPAVAAGKLDGIVTNWGNPLPGFSAAMHMHTDLPFYTSVFFVVMNRARYEGLPADLQLAMDTQSGDALVDRFGQLWNTWDAPIRNQADGPGHTLIRVDESGRAAWRDALRPAARAYAEALAGQGSPAAPALYEKLSGMLSAG